MIQEGAIKPDSLEKFIATTQVELKEKRCQLINDITQIRAITSRLNLFSKEQRILLKFIRFENRSEFSRYNEIQSMIENQRKKGVNIAQHDNKFTRNMKKRIVDAKKEFLTLLKRKRTKKR